MKKKSLRQKTSKPRVKKKGPEDVPPILRPPYALVLADGSLGEPCWQVHSSRVTRGCYHLEFTGSHVVRSVCVRIDRKPHSRRVFARVRQSDPLQVVLGNLNSVEVYLVNSQMVPVDRSFWVVTQSALPAITP